MDRSSFPRLLHELSRKHIVEIEGINSTHKDFLGKLNTLMCYSTSIKGMNLLRHDLSHFEVKVRAIFKLETDTRGEAETK